MTRSTAAAWWARLEEVSQHRGVGAEVEGLGARIHAKGVDAQHLSCRVDRRPATRARRHARVDLRGGPAARLHLHARDGARLEARLLGSLTVDGGVAEVAGESDARDRLAVARCRLRHDERLERFETRDAQQRIVAVLERLEVHDGSGRPRIDDAVRALRLDHGDHAFRWGPLRLALDLPALFSHHVQEGLTLVGRDVATGDRIVDECLTEVVDDVRSHFDAVPSGGYQASRIHDEPAAEGEIATGSAQQRTRSSRRSVPSTPVSRAA